MKVRHFILLICLLSLGSCGKDATNSQVKLVGRVILPADTFVAGPSVGVALPSEINGRQLPFDSLPVQGFSSLIPLEKNQFLALQDNGFGTKKNSPDYPLAWFLINVRFGGKNGDKGEVNILQTTFLSDPDGFFLYPLHNPSSGRFFTGADLDPESFVLLPDGTIWLGDEFGPWLLHFNTEGKLISAPVGLTVPEKMLPVTGGNKEMQSPDHPAVLADEKLVAALERSGGLEGLALSHNGKFLYAAVEKKLVGDTRPTRRLILEFNLAQHAFTNHVRYYQADGPDISLAALETWKAGELLVTERDCGQGVSAKIKRIYSLKLNETTADGYLKKELVCDLMNILDSDGVTTEEPGALGLGKSFSFPFVTPEVLVAIDATTLLVANDNNYPMSTGRRPESTPDDTEFVLLELP